VDKSIYIGTATCVISIAIGAGVQIAVGIGIITQANALYFLIGTGVLFLVGVGFLVHGIRLKPKTTSSVSIINPQLGGNLKTTNPSIPKLFHAVICDDLRESGLIAWGAFVATHVTPDPHVFRYWYPDDFPWPYYIFCGYWGRGKQVSCY